MKSRILAILLLAISFRLCAQDSGILGDNVLRFYRLAIPITKSAYEEDLDSDYNNVLAFWRECEDYVNNLYVPPGFCFDVIEDEKLVLHEHGMIDEDVYNAGEAVMVQWGVNGSYFTDNSRLRITMSTNYGETFDYVLAESVPAKDGCCTVVFPDVNVSYVDVDFVTATRSMRAGIIKVEEIGGVAYTLTTLAPENGGGFTVTGGVESAIQEIHIGTESVVYDLFGRKLSAADGRAGIVVKDGKKYYRK